MLVRQSVALLGEVIREKAGARAYERIESLRRDMTSLRHAEGMANEQSATLGKWLSRLEPLGSEAQAQIAHAFTLMLELMNACENAYRTSRIRTRPQSELFPSLEARAANCGKITLVLTSHPTEARDPRNIRIFALIQSCLIDALERGFERERARLRALIAVAWAVPVARNRKPAVQDEAEHLFSVALAPQALSALLEANARGVPVRLRAWVGADRDGHPLVNERTLLASFCASRARLLEFLRARLEDALELAQLMGTSERGLRELLRGLSGLQRVERGDPARVACWVANLGRVRVGAALPPLEEAVRVTEIFPALVVPLELRAVAAEVREACASGEGTLVRMLRAVRALAGAGRGSRASAAPRAEHYAPALVLSMARSAEDVRAGCELVTRALGMRASPLRVVPLFEQADSLSRAAEIVGECLAMPEVSRALRGPWGWSFEVMVGYSDSAKESGVLASRVEVARALSQIERVCRRRKVTPIFFHGAGGSVDRGGGSIEDQTAAWPASALREPKLTIQGEMVERTFSSPEILHSFLSRLAHRVETARLQTAARPQAGNSATSPAISRLAAAAAENYRAKACSAEFMRVVREATLYPYLSELRIGSRPTARHTRVIEIGGCREIGEIRAIPWVLCWTQARVLFQTWWGVGSAWALLDEQDRLQLAEAYRTDRFFRAFVHQLGFTLAKVELGVWRVLLDHSGLPHDQARAVELEFAGEYRSALDFVHTLAGPDLLGFRPWLGTSIRLRSPMIHPLNLLQWLAVKRGDSRLLRETVTGIASGMLTTG